MYICVWKTHNSDKLNFKMAIRTNAKYPTMKIYVNCFLFCILCSINCFSQSKADPVIDSLKHVLSTSKEDTTQVNTLNALSKQYNSTGNYEKALEFASQAKLQAEKLNYQKGIAASYNNTGTAYKKHGDYEKSLENYLKAIAIREKIGDEQGVASSYSNIGNLYEFQENYEKALENYSIALKIREKIGDQRGSATSCSNLGFIYEFQGNYEKALNSYLRALKIGIETGNKKNTANSYNNIGNVNNNQGNYASALDNYLKSLKIREEIGDKSGTGDSYNSIGTIYYTQGDYEKAFANYFKALKIREETGDKKRMSGSYNNIGNVYIDKGDYEKAMNSHMKSLEINMEIGAKRGMAGSYSNIGMIYERQGNHEKALENHLKSLKLYEEIGEKKGIGISYTNIGNIYLMQNKLEESKKYLDQSLTIFKELGYKQGIKEAYSILSDLYEKKDDYKQSHNYYKKYILYRDSLVNEETRKKTIQSQMNYDFEKKEAIAKSQQEVKELKDRNEKEIIYGVFVLLVVGCLIVVWFFIQRRKVDKMIAKQEKEALEKNKFELELKWFNSELKALRSQMNPHFIFNCMASIQRFMIENDPASAAKFLSKFARLIRSILENSELAFISLDSELKMLEDYLDMEKLRFGKKFKYSISVDDSINPELIEIPSMLIQPYIENSIIHGIGPRKDEDGKIELTFRIMENVLLCEITDNGVGRKKATEIKSKMGLSHKSMGISILKERLELISAKENIDVYSLMIDLEDDNHVSLGTKVELKIPLRNRKLN